MQQVENCLIFPSCFVKLPDFSLILPIFSKFPDFSLQGWFFPQNSLFSLICPCNGHPEYNNVSPINDYHLHPLNRYGMNTDTKITHIHITYTAVFIIHQLYQYNSIVFHQFLHYASYKVMVSVQKCMSNDPYLVNLEIFKMPFSPHLQSDFNLCNIKVSGLLASQK